MPVFCFRAHGAVYCSVVVVVTAYPGNTNLLVYDIVVRMVNNKPETSFTVCGRVPWL